LLVQSSWVRFRNRFVDVVRRFDSGRERWEKSERRESLSLRLLVGAKGWECGWEELGEGERLRWRLIRCGISTNSSGSWGMRTMRTTRAERDLSSGTAGGEQVSSNGQITSREVVRYV
jgi:hypothetical protein